jgi:hypothetical protein
MQDARKTNIPGFSRGTFFKSNDEKKKKLENQEFSNDGMKELTHLINQMEINQVNQIKQMEVN